MLQTQTGLPGTGASAWTTHRQALYQSIPGLSEFPLPVVIDGAKVYNQLNLPYYWLAYAGTLIGKETSTTLYAPSIIGQTTAAYTSGGTSVTVSAGTAASLNNRVGASGTFQIQGPPTAAGTNAKATVTYSAINLTTGVITVTNIGANYVSGSLIQPTDGSQNPLMLICDITGVKVSDWTNTNIINNYVVRAAVGGIVNTNMIPFWPSDTSIQAALQTQVPQLLMSSVYGY